MRNGTVKFPRVAAILLLAIGIPAGAAAHNFLPPPKSPGAVTVIPNISVSRAAYRELTPAYPVDWYRFSAKAGEAIFIQMTIPQIARFAGYSPSFAVVSSSSDWYGVTPQILQRATVELGDPTVRRLLRLAPGEHALTVDSNGAPPQAFHEPFTETNYWIKQTIRFTAPVSGSYEIAVFDRGGSPGKYVLATGEKERFTLRDIVHLPKVRRIVRRFMEVGT